MSESVSIIIPAYNEAARISSSLAEILAFARTLASVIEVIVVDDGSSDGTANIVNQFREQHPAEGVPAVSLIRHPRNRGKGAAVRTGFQAAYGDIVLFSDADLSTPITETPRIIEPIIRGEYEVVIGSRAMADSSIELQQSLLRRWAGRMFNRLVRCWTGLAVADSQCGFKAFRRTVAAPLFAVQRIDGFAFDVELLYLARRAGLRVLELPVRWAHSEGSKVSMAVHTWEMAIDLGRIRWHELRGRYQPVSTASSPAAGSGINRGQSA